MLEEFVHRYSNIARNLPQEKRRDVPALVIGNCRAPAIRVAELAMRTPLSDKGEIQILENPHDLARLEDGRTGH